MATEQQLNLHSASLDDLSLACDAVHGIGLALQSVDASTATRLGSALLLIAGTLKEVQGQQETV